MEAVESLLGELDGVKSVWHSKGFTGDFAGREEIFRRYRAGGDDAVHSRCRTMWRIDEGSRY